MICNRKLDIRSSLQWRTNVSSSRLQIVTNEITMDLIVFTLNFCFGSTWVTLPCVSSTDMPRAYYDVNVYTRLGRVKRVQQVHTVVIAAVVRSALITRNNDNTQACCDVAPARGTHQTEYKSRRRTMGLTYYYHYYHLSLSL